LLYVESNMMEPATSAAAAGRVSLCVLGLRQRCHECASSQLIQPGVA
jgi:hypothetical protein